MYKNINFSITVMNSFKMVCDRILIDRNGKRFSICRNEYNLVLEYDKLPDTKRIRDIIKYISNIIRNICISELNMKDEDIKFNIKYIKKISSKKLKFMLSVKEVNPLNDYIQHILTMDGRNYLYTAYLEQLF